MKIFFSVSSQMILLYSELNKRGKRNSLENFLNKPNLLKELFYIRVEKNLKEGFAMKNKWVVNLISKMVIYFKENFMMGL